MIWRACFICWPRFQLATHRRSRSTRPDAMRWTGRSVLTTWPGKCMDRHQLPLAIQCQRADLLDAMGRDDLAEDARAAAPPSGRDGLDQWLLAVEMLGQERYGDALPLLREARRELPEDLSVWLALGNALAGVGQLHEAEGCYTTCVTLWPECYLAFFQRGLCRVELGKFDQSKDDFDDVLGRRPRLPAALVNRASRLSGDGSARKGRA